MDRRYIDSRNTSNVEIVVESVIQAITDGIFDFLNIFYEYAQYKVQHPLIAGIPTVCNVGLDITGVSTVVILFNSVRRIGYVFTPYLILFYIYKCIYLGLIGQKKEFLNEVLYKTAKCYILMYSALSLAKSFILTCTLIINIFIEYVDADFAQLFLPTDKTSEIVHFILNSLTLTMIMVLAMLLYVLVLMRLMDLALIMVLTPLIIPFAEFVDRGLYTRTINIFIGIPIAHFTTILCLSVAYGFSLDTTPAIKSIGVIGTVVITISSMIFTIASQSSIKSIFKIHTVDVVNLLVDTIKGIKLAEGV